VNLDTNTYVQHNRKSKRDKRAEQRQRIQLRIDVPMILTVICLLIAGLVMVYSASYDYSFLYYGEYAAIFYRQVLWMLLGLAGAVFLVFFDYRRWKKLALVAMAITVFSLVAVLLVNEVRNGAVRTLFGGSIQPSEMAKLVIIIYLAVWLTAKKDRLSDFNIGLIPLAMILGLFCGLIIIQPDFSAVITILMLGGLMFFLAGGDLKQIGILMVIALVIGFGIILLSSTGSARIENFLSGLKDPSQGSFHVRLALVSFLKGGWFGAGIGNAETKLTGLPVPPTDSIFAVVGEELGIAGAIALVGLFTYFLWRGLSIAKNAPDQFGQLLAAGLTLWITLEAFINMSVMVNILPFAGNALPFISAGGSNLVVSLAAVGILLNISRLGVDKKTEEGKVFDAVINMRRWNWRGSVSSPRRHTGAERK
jgi:cell division protein FtsW